MKRIALIISNPGEPNAENYCNGVLVDVENFRSFLISPLGGAWFGSEIHLLDRPTQQEVNAKIQQANLCDYSLVIFAGHGYFSSVTDSTILEIRPGYEYDSLNLRTGANKRLIILDCCRKVYPEPCLESESRLRVKFAVSKELDPFKCRIYYDEAISKCSNGILVGYGCSIDETSGDGGSKGGYYSSSLIRSCKNWFDNTDVNLSAHYSFLSFVKAHELAISRVETLSGGIQNPEIEKPRSQPYFPFAIMA